MAARALMVLGTASHVGKSLVVTALGRILSNRGYRVAPFKAQNMALNSAATVDGREIGRAQALQAEACRVTATVEMNPVLIKPTSDTGAQVVVQGKVWGQVTARDYHQRRVEELFPVVVGCYQTLAAAHDIVVMEGAGSPAEINLKARDIVNMRMAAAADAACLLVGDIDRGGVFASLLGTMALLDRSERQRIRGVAINKFRGDQSLLTPGIHMIERRVRRRCMGVIPYIHGLGLDEEDSVALEDRRTVARAWRSLRISTSADRERPLRVGVIALPRMANFTDFGPLAHEPDVELAFLERPEDVEHADVAILPGTKATLEDLRWLRTSGFAGALIERATRKQPIVGICGGLQMLGQDVRDPAVVESGGAELGLSLLRIRTELTATKTTIPASASWSDLRMFGEAAGPARADGYEIHMGETHYLEGVQPFCEVHRAGVTGVVSDGAVTEDGFIVGTYLHGLFDSDSFRHAFIRTARAASDLAPPAGLVSVAAQRDERLNRLAAHVEAALDVDALLRWQELPASPLGGVRHHV
ncbi:MAG TPA: cobyric acid synthase [Vicinamibacterales bacterium]|nr:cobyric acid synthase [Vicinamibacterales bacterium]